MTALPVVIGGGAAVIIAIPFGIVLFFGGTANAAGCGTANAAPASAPPAAPIDGYSGSQLTGAADIMDAAATAGQSQQAQVLGVMASMEASHLTNLPLSAATVPGALGVFQQGPSWGSAAQRSDPTQSAAMFYAQLAAIPGWQQMPPTAAAHAVQGNADPNAFTQYFSEAGDVVAALSATGSPSGTSTPAPAGECTVSGDQQTLAKTLMADYSAGRLIDFEPNIVPDEIGDLTSGKPIPAKCGVDVRVLQILVLAVQKYGSVSISDMNRPCVGDTLDCATSPHCTPLPTTAFDVYALGGKPLMAGGGNNYTTGHALTLDLDYVTWLASLVPQGSMAGQAECRTRAGMPASIGTLAGFTDYCTHQHIDMRGSTAALNVQVN